MKYSETDIREVKEQLLWNRQYGHSTIFLLGSGVSVSGGIPDSEGIISRIRQDFSSLCARMHPVTYEDHLEVLTASQRQELIKSYVQESRVNSAHLYLATLVKAGYTRTIFTTNFDTLIPRALALENIFPTIYDFQTMTAPLVHDMEGPSVVHLHGRTDGILKHDGENGYFAQQEKLKSFFQELFEKHTVIVVGYCGAEDPVLGFLSDIRSFENRLYWIGNGENDPEEHVIHGVLNKPSKHSCFVKGYDADQFFMALSDELQLPVPRILNNPLDLVAEVLGDIASKPREIHTTAPVVPKVQIPEIKPVIPQETEKPLPEEKKIEAAIPEKKTKVKIDLPKAPINSITEFARESWTSKNWSSYETLKTAVENSEDSEEKKYFAYFLFHWGESLQKEAEGENPTAAKTLLTEAATRYREALTASEEVHEVNFKLGTCLLHLATLMDADDAEILFEEAFQRFEDAMSNDSKDFETLQAWSQGLIRLAETKGEVEAQRLYFQAFDKYKAILKINPELIDVYIQWGVGLCNLAAMKRDDEAELYLDEAFDKFAAAVKKDSENQEAYIRWGIGLRQLARIKRSAEALALYEGACTKYATAQELNPTSFEASMNWTQDLCNLAMLKGIEEAQRLLKSACDKYETIAVSYPEKFEIFNNWGIALWNLGNLKSGKESQQIYKQSFEKFDQALSLDPNSAEVYTNKGICMGKVAYMAEMSKTKDLYYQAGECFKNALAIKPGLFEAYYHWGITLRNEAETLQNARTEELFIQSLKQFEKAMKTKPEKHKLHKEWDERLVNLSRAVFEEEPEKLYHDTFKKYQEAIFTERNSLELYNNYDINLTMSNPDENDGEYEKLYSEVVTK